jgi:hypothetical protein
MDEIDRQTVINTDGALLWTGRFFWFFGVIEMLCALGSPAYFLGYAPFAEAPLPWAPAIGFGLGGCLGFGFHGLLNLLAGTGIGRGSKFGWYLGVLLSVLYIPNCSFFFAVFFLYALLRGKVREAYLG